MNTVSCARPFSFCFLSTLIAAGLFIEGPAFAQDKTLASASVTSEGKVLYNVDYFARYTPNTAAEMVAQIPGFQLENESGARGFGQGSGNLLINGKRPTSKNSNAETQLGRIPTNQVERIELLKNGSPELAGQAGLIVNVVTKNNTNFSGTAEAGFFAVDKSFIEPTGRLSLNWGKGDWSFNLDARRRILGWRQAGPETLREPDEMVTEEREDVSKIKVIWQNISLGTSWNGQDGKALNLNFKGERYKNFYSQEYDRFSPSAGNSQGVALGSLINNNDEHDYNYEASGDYTFPALGGAIKLIGLRRFEDSKFAFGSRNNPLEGVPTFFKGTMNPVVEETLLRNLYTRQAGNSVFELALEGAINKLSQNSTFAENNGQGLVEFDLSGSNRSVKEKRSEASFLASHSLDDKWLFQGSLAGEYSEISVEGAPEATRTFFRPKGFVSGQYSFDNNRIWLRLDRRVGQLNLFDFVSFVDVFEETETQGNVRIVPDQSWDIELAGEHRFGKDNIAKLKATYSIIEDYQATLPLPGGGEGPGNLQDNAKRFYVEASVSLATDDWGIKGGRLDISANTSHMSMTDPVTGEIHGLDRRDSWHYKVDFRQDIPNTDWAWGGYIRHWRQKGLARVSQVYTEKTNPWLQFFVEHKNLFGMTAELTAQFVPFSHARESRRAFYESDRNGTLTGYKDNERAHSKRIEFTLTKTF